MARNEAVPSELTILSAYTADSMIDQLTTVPHERIFSAVAKALTGEQAEIVLVSGTFQGFLSELTPAKPGEVQKIDEEHSIWGLINTFGRPLYNDVLTRVLVNESPLIDENFVDTLVSEGSANHSRVPRSKGNKTEKIPTVNNVWQLQRGPDGLFLPWARVVTIDDDAKVEARPRSSIRWPRGIVLAERAVVFKGLMLPSTEKTK